MVLKQMLMLIAFVCCCLAVGAGCVTIAEASIHSRLDIPTDVKIVPADDSLPLEFKHFPRQWEGTWLISEGNRSLDVVFIVEHFVNTTTANIIYKSGNGINWGSGYYYRGPTKVFYNEGELKFVHGPITLYYQNGKLIGTNWQKVGRGLGEQKVQVIMNPF